MIPFIPIQFATSIGAAIFNQSTSVINSPKIKFSTDSDAENNQEVEK